MLTLFLSFLLVCGLYSFSSVFRLPFSWWQSTEISKSPMCNPHCPKQTPNLFFQLLNKIPVLHFDWTPLNRCCGPEVVLEESSVIFGSSGWERSPPTHSAAGGRDTPNPQGCSRQGQGFPNQYFLLQKSCEFTFIYKECKCPGRPAL